MRDTIVAIATATGGGVGMVRLSGPQALAVAGRVFRPMNPAKSPETMPGYTCLLYTSPSPRDFL